MNFLVSVATGFCLRNWRNFGGAGHAHSLPYLVVRLMNDSVFPNLKLSETMLDENGEEYQRIRPVSGGLTKRELFSAMALQGIVTENPGVPGLSGRGARVVEAYALAAVMLADALIAELAQEIAPAEAKA